MRVVVSRNSLLCIVISELMMPVGTATRTCPECLSEGHDADAKFCKDCGAPLPAYRRDR